MLNRHEEKEPIEASSGVEVVLKSEAAPPQIGDLVEEKVSMVITVTWGGCHWHLAHMLRTKK